MHRNNTDKTNETDDGLFFDFSADTLELDFDIDDFQMGDSYFNIADESHTNSRIMPPTLDGKNLTRAVSYTNAADFVRQLDIQKDFRQFAWVSGDFVFGDIIEAMIAELGIMPKSISVCSLGISPENIESLHTILTNTNIEELNMLLSGFWYSHGKNDDVPFMYDRLDIDNKFQVAFGNYHMKMILFETELGNKIVAHGSANMRSSNSIEQVMIENNAELYNWNYKIIKELCALYGTIDKSKKYRLGRNESWQVVQSQQ